MSRIEEEGMKKIEVIIQPGKLCALKVNLASLGVDGMTVTEVKGFGQGRGSHIYRVGQDQATFVPKVKIETVVKDQHVGPTIDVIIETCWTGKVGDGKIFVSPVEEVIRIRTNERGENAVKTNEVQNG